MSGIAGRWAPRALRARVAGNAAERLERRVGMGIAILVPVFAVIGAVVMLSDEGPNTVPRRIVCAVVLATTIPVGTWWWNHRESVVRMPGWFVFYADVGVTLVLLTFADRGLALHATVLFAVIGIYIAYFSKLPVLRLHTVFVSVTIVCFAVFTYLAGIHDASSVVAQALVSLVVVNSVIVFRAVIKAQLDLATTDSLTGLLNRRGFEHRIERILTEADERSHVGVFVVDLDRFKSVNDTHGHAAGDAVLRATAVRLADAVPEGSCVARTGGEEFTIATVIEPSETEIAAAAISTALAADDALPVTGSVGAAVLPVAGWQKLEPEDAASMVHSAMLKADTAMYAAKRSGGNQAKLFRG